MCSMAFLYFHGDLSSCFSGMFQRVSEVNSYTVQNREDILVPSTPSVRSDFGFAVAVGHAWKSIPVGIRDSHTLGSFKRHENIFVGEEYIIVKIYK